MEARLSLLTTGADIIPGDCVILGVLPWLLVRSSADVVAIFIVVDCATNECIEEAEEDKEARGADTDSGMLAHSPTKPIGLFMLKSAKAKSWSIPEVKLYSVLYP